MTRKPSLPVAAALGALAAVAIALNAYQWTTTQEISPSSAGLALALLLMAAILPWTAGRPAIDPALVLCHKCGAPSPSNPDASFCLMCGAFPRAARTAA